MPNAKTASKMSIRKKVITNNELNIILEVSRLNIILTEDKGTKNDWMSPEKPTEKKKGREMIHNSSL